MMNLVPRREFARSLSGFDKSFDSMMDEFFGNDNRGERASSFKLDLKEEDDAYLIEAELPGVAKEEIKIDIQSNYLMINVSQDKAEKTEEEGYLHKERSHYSATRSIYLKDIDKEAIEAKLEEGILRIRVPKKEKVIDQRTIEIQ